jgi:curved DNA-binding protein
MSVSFEDYYATLGVSRTATADEIQRAYRKLARECHPDVNKAPEAAAKFKKVAEAYEVLKDTDKRSRYDALGPNWKQGEAVSGGPWGPGGASGGRSRGKSRKQSGTAPAGDGAYGRDFSDFFSTIFNQGGGGGGGGPGPGFGGSRGGNPFGDMHEQAPPPPRDHRIEVTITLREAVLGGTRNVSLRYPDGTSRSFDIKINPGTKAGDIIRLAGQGLSGEPGSRAGDLLIAVTVAADPRFRIEGTDLVSTITLTPWEACLGTKLDIPLIDGTTATVSVPAGSASGKRLRLKGRGVPASDSASRPAGDLLLELAITTPQTLTDRERLLLEELAAISSFRPRS